MTLSPFMGLFQAGSSQRASLVWKWMMKGTLHDLKSFYGVVSSRLLSESESSLEMDDERYTT